MSGRAARLPHGKLLHTGWSVCAVPAGAPAPPAEAFAPISAPLTAAAAMRELRTWTLDGPAQDFDAQDWWYRAVFDRPHEDSSVLGFDGLATVANLWLNGQELGASRSMFVARRFDVGPLLRPSGNELLIRFSSLLAELATRRPRPRWRAPMVAHQQLRWWRTTLLGRTPGWSPPAAPVGPWRDVWLARPEPGDSMQWRLTATARGTEGHLRCEAWFDAEDAARIESASVHVVRHGGRHAQPLARHGANCHYSAELRVPDADLWWPHTHGEPALYDASLLLRWRDGTQQLVDLGRVGFRSLAWDTQDGRFALRVNGQPVFCRGAGWTPLDPVSLRATPEATRDAVAQARGAGMNMLRVAGTLVYEEDHFYDACDELGVLVWQDFMFANMDYPAGDPGFDADVQEEARQLLRRLRSRPCLALLCGNSEVEQQAAMWGAPRELWHPALFHETLPRLCAQEAPALAYWPSSAHGGAFPHQADCGTTSYYGVGAYLRPLEDARRSNLRFASECLAFANIPGDAALSRLPGGLATRVHHPAWKARSPRDLGAGWDFDDVRDHYLETLFKVDARSLRQSDHDRYLLLGRLATGQAMAAAFADWRRPGSSCGGALLLMLRDLWAGAGWGVVDDAGGPKPCWHLLRRSLQPLALFLSDEGGNGLYAHVVHEHGQPRDTVLEIAAWRDGEVLVAQGSRALQLAPRSEVTVPCAGLFDHWIDLGWAWRFGPPACHAVFATLRDTQGAELAQAVHFPTGWPSMQEPDIGLAAQVEAVAGDRARVEVTTRRLALGVHLDLPGWEAQDDFFHLAPGASVRVDLRATGRAGGPGTVHAMNSRAAAAIAGSGDLP